MFRFRYGSTMVAVLLPCHVAYSQVLTGGQTKPASGASAAKLVIGPSGPVKTAIAAGATATITLQPVPPKTVPASSYPAGSSIVDQTLTLGAVPARVWLEIHVTGWAPETLMTVQAGVSASDPEMDGGGYSGAAATCNGHPAIGAGDITPARQACNVSADCRPNMSGIASPCAFGEPCRCSQSFGNYFPPGKWCEPGFQDLCDPQGFGSGIAFVCAVDISTVNYRYGFAAEAGEVPTDFSPTYIGTLVLDVPADAKGTYTIDFRESDILMRNPSNTDIPIAALNPAVISTSCCDCETNADCNDNDACTIETCVECVCQYAPIPGWDPATECCSPTNGTQAPIPQDLPCRIAGCSLGGSSGTVEYTDLPDGTACAAGDPCYQPGQCISGECDGEQYAGPDCLKSRFISIEPNADSNPKAYRVRLLSLHHPDPPYRDGPASDFSAFEGEYRWVGQVESYIESAANLTPVHASVLQCAPHYRDDWASFGLVHVAGTEVVPSSIYEVQSIEEGLDIGEESNYSAPILLRTGAWADVYYPYSPPSSTVQPDFTDLGALVDKFRSTPAAVSKVRAMLLGPGGADIPALDIDVDFAQVSATNDAIKGKPYPNDGPAPCP